MSLISLPFVDKGRLWHVKKSEYGKACDIGSQYARDFVCLLKNDPFYVGAAELGQIANAMARYQDDEQRKGYAVGFWAEIEKLLYQAVK